jgi:sugar (pentulose or hexulose) kinase
MNGKIVLGIDCGGSEIKCGAFDHNGVELAVASHVMNLTTSEEGCTERNA